MTNLRLIVPVALVAQVLALLDELAAVTNVAHLPGAAVEPAGDLIVVDVAREDVSLVVERLCALGVDEQGGISITGIDASVSRGARQAMRSAEGYASDAVLWEQVEETVSESTELSASFLLFMALATCLAAIGILNDSSILIVGAMVVGPEFGPLAALCVAIVRRAAIARRSAVALLVGFLLAIAAAFVLTAILRAFDLGPDSAALEDRAQTFFISHPAWDQSECDRRRRRPDAGHRAGRLQAAPRAQRQRTVKIARAHLSHPRFRAEWRTYCDRATVQDGEDVEGASCSAEGSKRSGAHVSLLPSVEGRLAMPEPHRTAVTQGSGRWMVASAALLVGGALAVAATLSAGAEARAAAVPANVSPPTISGSAVSGETVTAGSGSWSGTLPITYGYEWQRCDATGAACAPIPGATGVSYVVASADVGSTLRVSVTATNAEGSASASSGPTAVVTTPVAPAPTAEPVVSGAVVEGSTLSTTNGSWTGTPPIAFAYQWLRCGADGGLPDGSNCALIAGATGASYTLASADVGQRLRIRVTGSNGAGAGTATSNATAEIQQSTTIGAPRNTEEPSISGTTTQGRILTALVGAWAGATPLSYSYQWVRCPADGGLGDGSNCATMSGASSRTYTLAAGDVGSRMRVRVTAANSLGIQTATSNATAGVLAASSGSGSSATGPRNTSLPTIVGIAAQGQALIATAGLWTGTMPITYSYQWLRCDVDGGGPSGADCDEIDEARSVRYVVTQEDVARRLRVEVEADNVADFEYARSDATAVVTATTATTTPPTPTTPSGPLPPGAIRLSSGKYSIPVTSVSAPERLVVDSVTFSPNPVRARSTRLEVRVHVVDTRGYVVRDALAFARATPIVTSAAPEQRTARDGWARISLSPRGDFPLRSGYSVQFFVRVRKDGEPLLAGVSTRRLVQVATAG